jgi:hypothetical protein
MTKQLVINLGRDFARTPAQTVREFQHINQLPTQEQPVLFPGHVKISLLPILVAHHVNDYLAD